MLVVNVPGDGGVNVRGVDDDRVHDEDEDDMQEEEEEGGNIVHDGDDDASCDVDDDDVDEDDNRTFHSYYLRKDERQHRRTVGRAVAQQLQRLHTGKRRQVVVRQDQVPVSLQLGGELGA